MVMTRSKTNEYEEDGNLGDDEKELSNPENLVRRNRRKIKYKAFPCHDSPRKRRKKRMYRDSSGEDICRFSIANTPESVSSLQSTNKLFNSIFCSHNQEGTKFHSIQCNNAKNSAKTSRYGLTDDLFLSSSTESNTETETNCFELYKRKNLPPDICLQCEQKPKNSLFAHIRIGHQLFCYECAKMWWRYHDKCPFCSQRILQVLQIVLV